MPVDFETSLQSNSNFVVGISIGVVCVFCARVGRRVEGEGLCWQAWQARQKYGAIEDEETGQDRRQVS